MIEIIIQDFISIFDEIDYKFELGVYVLNSISVTDQIVVNLIFTKPDEIEIGDELLVEVYYSRFINDSVEVEDAILEGEPILVMHSIEDRTNYGPLQIHTVSPTGPLSISGGRDCYPIPTGFVIIKGDYVECNDRLDVGMVFEQTINDSIEVTG